MHSATAILSTENLIHNVATIRNKVPYARILAMIKANAYGHGIRSVALRIEPYVDGLGVARIEEAIALRAVGVRSAIVIMSGVFSASAFALAAQEKFSVVLHDIAQLHWLEKSVLSVPLRVWIKIDTGLGRLGFHPEAGLAAYIALKQDARIEQPIGVMSHMACADVPQHLLNTEQLSLFAAVAQQVDGPKSICNSAGVFAFPEHHYDLVRPGIALYGISPLAGISAASLDLKPVMTINTRLIAVKQVQKGKSLGYGAGFICPETMPIGIIALGYGDGLPRTMTDGAPIMVNDVCCRIVGRVSMDMVTIDLRACPTACVGDPVVVWGEGLPLEELVAYTSHIPYDMLTAVQSRVKFTWTA